MQSTSPKEVLRKGADRSGPAASIPEAEVLIEIALLSVRGW